jgi:hypothetical protein
MGGVKRVELIEDIGERGRGESPSRCGLGLADRSAPSTSGRVEGYAVKRKAGAEWLSGGATRDDMQSAAFALGA